MRRFSAADANVGRLIGAIRSESPTRIVSGIVLRVIAERRAVQVRIRGAASVATCDLAEGLEVSVGDDVLVAFIRGTERAVVIAVTGTLQSYLAGPMESAGANVPGPPDSVVVTPLFRACLVEWWAPAREGQFFVVEGNTSAAEDGDEVTLLVTQGSHYLYNGTTYSYFRVAGGMVTAGSLIRSDWSSWVQGTMYEIVIDTSSDVVLHVDGQVLLTEVAL